jgi:hypothetical protein
MDIGGAQMSIDGVFFVKESVRLCCEFIINYYE